MTIEATTPETPEVEPEVAATPEAPETQLDANGEPIVPVEETEEVEHDGKKYKIPKPLKGALLMQADYTRKTQEVAEQRKQVEGERTKFEEERAAQAELIKDYSKLEAFNETLDWFEKLDWPTMFRDNRQQYDQLTFQRSQTVEARNKQANTLQTKLAERNSKAQQDSAKAVEDFRSKAVEAIPELKNPDYVQKLNAFGVSIGFTPEELGNVRDVRIVKALNAAYVGSQLQTRQAAVKQVETSQAVKPLPQVSGNAGNRISVTDPSSDKNLSTEEWAKRRNEQLRKKRA